MSPDAEIPSRQYMTDKPPRLLVSVRDVEEARAAIAGGCDILDVKEPANGSLGMANVETISAIATICAGFSSGLPLSAALGETTDWLDHATIPELPSALDFVKLGTAGLARRPRGLDDWIAVRNQFDAANQNRLNWVAVGYADWQRAAAPKPEEVLQAAIESSCVGMLIDTFVKDGRSLLEWTSIAELNGFSDAVQRAGMLFAVAGSLNVTDLRSVADCRPNVIAVRSAACDCGARRGPVTTAATRALREAMGGGKTPNGSPPYAGGVQARTGWQGR